MIIYWLLRPSPTQQAYCPDEPEGSITASGFIRCLGADH